MKNVFVVVAIGITLWSCGETKKQHGEANHHMRQNSFEELVDRFENPNRVSWQKPDLVIKKLGDLNGKVVADIGAGTGYFSRRMAQQGATVLALDVDSLFLDYIDKYATDSLAIVTRKIPYDDPTLDSAEADVIVIIDTYHHIDNRYEYLRDLWRGLKPGGQLMIVDFKKRKTPHGPPPEMRIKGFIVMKDLQKAGFVKVVIDVKTLNEQYIITAKKFDKAT